MDFAHNFSSPLSITLLPFVIQDWFGTIHKCLLFLSLGYFGGRNSFSKKLLLFGAPMTFVVQYRPVKLMIKFMFYQYFINPPSFLLSLLPAPYQAILSFNFDDSFDELYLTAAEKKAKATVAKQAKAGEGKEEGEDEEFFDAQEGGEEVGDADDEFYDADEDSYDGEVSDEED